MSKETINKTQISLSNHHNINIFIKNKLINTLGYTIRYFFDKNKLFKKRAKYFLDRDLVHCIASDMHHLSKRPSYMREAFEIISHKYGRKKAKELFVDNPNRIVTNQMIE